MPKERSPNYPRITIEKAIDKACSVYQKRGKRVSSRRAITRAMGHSGEHLAHIAALRAYGLLDGRVDDLSLTPLAVIIAERAEEPGHPERVRAVKSAAFGPDVFSDLQQHLGPGRLPSRASCYRWLTDRGFAHKGATRVVWIYRANVKFLAGLTGELVQREVLRARPDRTAYMTPREFLDLPGDFSDRFHWTLTPDTGHRPERRATARFHLRATPKSCPSLILGPLRAVAFARTGHVPHTWADAAIALDNPKLPEASAIAAATNDRTWIGKDGHRTAGPELLEIRQGLLAAVGLIPSVINATERGQA